MSGNIILLAVGGRKNNTNQFHPNLPVGNTIKGAILHVTISFLSEALYKRYSFRNQPLQHLQISFSVWSGTSKEELDGLTWAAR